MKCDDKLSPIFSWPYVNWSLHPISLDTSLQRALMYVKAVRFWVGRIRRPLVSDRHMHEMTCEMGLGYLSVHMPFCFQRALATDNWEIMSFCQKVGISTLGYQRSESD